MLLATTIKTREERLLWTAMATLAAMLVFLTASQTAGANTAQVPATLSDIVQQAAQPMPEGMPEVPFAEQPANQPDLDMVRMVWTALDHQQRGEWEESLDVWRSLNLAYDRDQWRHVAIAQASMALGQYEEAAQALDAAEVLAPDNAVVHYFRGLLRLDQVDHAYDWQDAVGPADVRYVSYVPDVVPNSRAMYRYTARVELEQAIRLADRVKLDQPLTPDYWYSTMAIGPTVGDLLLATGADNFQARAHNVLGGLLLEEGALDKAEYHIDRAAQADMFVSFNYVDLIDEFEARGYYLDAARVCAKAVGHGLTEEAAHARAMANLRTFAGW